MVNKGFFDWGMRREFLAWRNFKSGWKVWCEATLGWWSDHRRWWSQRDFSGPQSATTVPCKQQYYYEPFITRLWSHCTVNTLPVRPMQPRQMVSAVKILRECSRVFVKIGTINSDGRRRRGGDCGYFLQQRQFVLMILNKRIISGRIVIPWWGDSYQAGIFSILYPNE